MICPLLSFVSIVKTGLLLQSCLIGMQPSYTTHSLKIGAEVFDIELKHEIEPETVEKIKQDLREHRLLVFRNQGNISAERQVEIAQWFGAADPDHGQKHPIKPSPYIARFSNDESHGDPTGGRKWHIDGVYRKRPHSILFLYMVTVPQEGNTRFVGSRELIESLSDKQKERWSKLWAVYNVPGIIHPLLYKHPITKQLTICLNLRRMVGFIYDFGTHVEQSTTDFENAEILKDIEDAIIKDDERLVYSHKWKDGDLIIADNLALVHESSVQARMPAAEVGLRILHRIIVGMEHIPQK